MTDERTGIQLKQKSNFLQLDDAGHNLVYNGISTH